MKLPILYKKTETGAVQFWEIEVTSDFRPEGDHGIITTVYGQLGTDSPQSTKDVVREGKNLGKANATTAYEQAEAEARAKWTKQKKKGYVETVEAAQAGEKDAVITGGVDPMLAHHYMDVIYDMRPGHEGKASYELSKDSKKIKFPALAQPKFDGIRSGTEASGAMWSRTRKPIWSCPHIQEEVADLLSPLDDFNGFIDGELYNHAYKKDFEKIASAVRKGEPSEESKLVELHVYDVVCSGDNEYRQKLLRELFRRFKGSSVKLVETVIVNSHEEFVRYFESCLARGYEGAMLRNMNAEYEQKRSYNLQKAKPFMDAEFEIVGFTEGRGKLAGHLGTFICKTEAGDTFETPMNGEQSTLKAMFENGQSYVGKLLTVRFQNYTGARNVPRFPKGHSVRDYE